MSLAVAMPTAAELVSRALEKFDPHQLRDPGGENGGQWIKDPASAAISALDKLKLGKRAPDGFTVHSSKKLRTDYADVGIAEVDGPDGRHFRIGVIGNESGKWDAGFVGEARKAQLRQEIDRKQALMDSDDDDVDDDIEDQISELQSELEDLDGERTAIVSPEQMADFRRQLGEGLEVAKANKAKVDADMKVSEAIDEKRDAIIAEHSDPGLEKKVRELSWRLRQAQGIVRELENDLTSGRSRHGWDPEFTAERLASWKENVAKYEAELAPLLARRAELMPPYARARLEDLDRQFNALNDVAIDDMLTAAEVSAPNGARVRAEIWGSDDEDEQWVSTRLYVLTPGETSDDIDDDYGSFRGLKGLNKLIAGLDTSRSPEAFDTTLGVRSMPLSRALESFKVMSPSPAVQLMMYARVLEMAADSFMRKGHLIHVERGKGGRFAKKGVAEVIGDVVDAAQKMTDSFADRDPGGRSSSDKVRDAFAELKSPGHEWVGLADIREKLDAHGLSREQQDAAFRDMLKNDSDVRIIPVANTKALKPRDHLAALDLGGSPVHAMSIRDENRRWRSTPTGKPVASNRSQQEIQIELDALKDQLRVTTDERQRVALEQRISQLDPSAKTDARKTTFDQLRAMRENPKSGDSERVMALLKPMKHGELDAVAAELGIGPLKGTKLQKQQRIERALVGAELDRRAIANVKLYEPPSPATKDEADSYFASFKSGFAASVQADRERALAKKAGAPTNSERADAVSGVADIWGARERQRAEIQTSMPRKAASRSRKPAAEPLNPSRIGGDSTISDTERGDALSGMADVWGARERQRQQAAAMRAEPGSNDAKVARVNQITAELRDITDPEQRSRLKAERRRLQSDVVGVPSPIDSAVGALRPMVDNPQRGDREKTEEILGKLTGKQLEEVAKAYGVGLLGRTVPEKRTQLTERLVGYKLNSLVLRNSPWTQHDDAVPPAFSPKG